MKLVSSPNWVKEEQFSVDRRFGVRDNAGDCEPTVYSFISFNWAMALHCGF